jgi:hypothetical protein
MQMSSERRTRRVILESTRQRIEANHIASLVQAIKAKLQASPSVVGFPLKVEKPCKKRIQELADKEGVPPGMLMQALWETVQRHPTLIQCAIESAKKQHEQREADAELKKALASIEKALTKFQ